MDREPAVAGTFYPASAARLAQDVASLLATSVLPDPNVGPAAPAPAPARALGVLAPHAGYVYSGAVAGATYARVLVPERALVLCPNHTGLGARVALWPGGAWRTPVGRVAIDAALTEALAGCPQVEADRAAHLQEHAIEVQLPFLHARNPAVRIAALCLGPLGAEEAVELGRAVARVLARLPALLVASSDMSHYVPAAVARRLDRRALDRVVALDPAGLHELVRRERISMCGVVPATVMLAAALALGATSAELIGYATSGDVTGDDERVVGYAGAVVR